MGLLTNLIPRQVTRASAAIPTRRSSGWKDVVRRGRRSSSSLLEFEPVFFLMTGPGSLILFPVILRPVAASSFGEAPAQEVDDLLQIRAGKLLFPDQFLNYESEVARKVSERSSESGKILVREGDSSSCS
jgi:hypothetical protein